AIGVSRPPARRTLQVLVLAVMGASCASAPIGRFVWVDEYKPPAAQADTGVIRPGDLLDVRVLGQDQMSAKVHVPADGQVTLPFLNDIPAAGQTPAALRPLIEEKLKEYINTPVVTVSIEKGPPAPILILGQVGRPGKYAYERNMGVLSALAQAGGLKEYA